MSVIYYNQRSQIKADKCKTIVTFDTLPESKILDAGDITNNINSLNTYYLL